MHNSFLEYVLSDLEKKAIPTSDCTFILPSKRSGTFLKKHISATLKRNIFSPDILSIEDFVVQISGLSPIPNMDLVLSLFEVYRNSDIKEKDDFNAFLKWGQTLLQDFNEIDRYLIPPKDILNYLSAIKELSHWSLKKNKTELVQNYLELWQHLYPIYSAFSAKLLYQNKGYQGLIYRTAVENMEAFAKNREETPIIFIGFNALNTAESKIIQHFLENPINQIYWDIDSHFLSDPIHDAGLFIRNYQKEWPYFQTRKLVGIHNSFLQPKKISITGVPKSISQAKFVGKLLEDIQAESSSRLQNTSVVLADESLLNPVLQAIPSAIKEVNITMGMPLNKTVLYSFFSTFLDLQLGKSDRGWFYVDILNFIANPYTSIVSNMETQRPLKQIAQDIKTHNWLYLKADAISNYTTEADLIKVIFPTKSFSPLQWVDNCLWFIQRLKTFHQDRSNNQELEYLYRFYTLFNQLKEQLTKVDFLTDLRSVKSFFKHLSSTEALDFIGEPLSGLQLMGMLESRNLDFETVIISSVNEGILPSGKSHNSFIPFDVKREYGLPTYKEKDAIYTYHFYRLIQRAKNIYLVYNTEPDVLEGGEKSRLISQLLTDDSISKCVTHTIASPQVSIAPESTSQITKSQRLIEDIKHFAENGFSPTSLTNYIRNPLDFYKRNILKINDLEEVEETIAANTFGTIVHDSLEQLYQPLVGEHLITTNVTALKNNISATVQEHFTKNLPGVNIGKGRYLLVYNVIVKYLKNFVALELQQIQQHEIKLLALEEKYEVNLAIKGLDFSIKLKGTLDRIDEVDGKTRIVDYKTGRVEPGHVKVKNWEDLIADYDKSKAFQLLCYAYLYSNAKGSKDLQAGIYSFKNLGRGFLPFSTKGTTISPEILQIFEDQLHVLITEICNPTIPFLEKTT